MYQLEYWMSETYSVKGIFTLIISNRHQVEFYDINKWTPAFMTTTVTTEDITTDSIKFTMNFSDQFSNRKARNIFIGRGNQPVDWFPAYGCDYTSLTEQLILGEFFLDKDGITKKQVYQKTHVFKGNSTYDSNSKINYFYNRCNFFADKLINVQGWLYRELDNLHTDKIPVAQCEFNTGLNVNGDYRMYYEFNNTGDTNIYPCTAVVAIKYTKI